MSSNDETCPGCGAPVDEARVRDEHGVGRFSCLSCGLQLVRRADKQWTAIRG
jgi:Zn ribbon nucleic-acid-binding protein